MLFLMLLQNVVVVDDVCRLFATFIVAMIFVYRRSNIYISPLLIFNLYFVRFVLMARHNRNNINKQQYQ